MFFYAHLTMGVCLSSPCSCKGLCARWIIIQWLCLYQHFLLESSTWGPSFPALFPWTPLTLQRSFTQLEQTPSLMRLVPMSQAWAAALLFKVAGQ